MADDNMAKLEGILAQFEVNIAEANDLTILYDYEIVIIADDSGSMMAPSQPRPGSPTRWDELKDTLGLIVELGSCFDDSGIDIYFLNRPKLEGVKSAYDSQFVEAFQRPPSGTTPLTETLSRVVKEEQGEKPTLLFILTDGVPNGGPQQFCSALRNMVQKRSTSKTVKVQIMACTGDDAAVGYLDDLDRQLTELDCTDDYYTERDQVLRSGRAPKFTRGDWCMKAMLGPVSQKFDAWDEGRRQNVPARAGALGTGVPAYSPPAGRANQCVESCTLQ